MGNSSTSPVAARRFVTRKYLVVSVGAVILAIALFGLLGYYWLPSYAKTRIEVTLSEKLNRLVTIQSIDIQPYTLEFTVLGFRVAEKANTGNILFTFDRLYVDLSIESIRHLAPVVSTVTLTAPRLHLVREDKHRFNISDLIEQFKPQPGNSADDAQGKSHFSISNISIYGGAVVFEDRLKKSQQNIDEIKLGIPFIANFKSAQTNLVEPHLSARINGAPFALEGKLRPFTNKREATLSLKFNDIDLTDIDEYSPIPVGFRLLSGNLDSDLSLAFTQVVDKAPTISLSGRAALKELTIDNEAVQAPHQVALKRLDVTLRETVLTEPQPVQTTISLVDAKLTRHGETEPVMQLPKLNIDTIKIDRAQRHIELGAVILNEAKTLIRRQADGQLDLAQLFIFVSPSENTAPEATLSSAPRPIQTSEFVIPIPDKKPANRTDASSESEKVVALSTKTTVPIPNHKPAYPTKTGIAETNIDQGKVTTESATTLTNTETSKAWTTQIGQVKLNAASVRFEDHTLAKIVPMNIDSLNLVINNIDLSGIKPLDLVLQATINHRGSIDTRGTLAWAPLTTNLAFDFKDVDLVPLQGWASDRFNTLLSQGDFSFQGNIKASGEPLKIALNGKGQLTNFNILDKNKASRLLRWKNIDLTGVQFISEPLRVDIASVDLTDFYARVTLLPNKQLNLHSLARQEDPTPIPASISTGSVSQTVPVVPADNAPLPVYIDKIVLRNGDINFADQFIKPNYRANLTRLKGQIGPLHPDKSGKIDIQGLFDRSAPLHISGMIDPFSGQLSLDIVSTVTGIDLPTFSPYSGRYIGYVIEKGKLSLDVNYHIEKGELKAKNKIFLDQLVLGDKTDSPEAVSLPLHLAISLLKNRHGEIDIRLPLKGSINDPEFSLTGIIWTAFVNLITKAVTAPFTLLGSLFNDGEELSEINFPSGYATLQSEAEKRLQTLSTALLDRPALKLEITGFADPINDQEELKRALLDRRIKAQKLSASVKEGQTIGSLEEIELNEKEYTQYLTRVYKETDFKKPKNIIGLTKSLPVGEMEQLILANTTISDDELHELAEQRASTVLYWLIEQGGIPSERVFVLGTKVESTNDDQKQNNRVEFSIK
ncbi:DUF748 domain-containing protein [Nitrosomonas sp. Is37]|uniref:DUF748 domain-containing protein n=1 Tax=Nitrosomonas sp. Is37 TaxID=3080535 RepID=UPI00294ACC6A|nr:DUF748 domain-containing protein [Nitrosomonas sp. Is37]MDV6343003.1 DUF748 domain-containing protein [Nitrosomonas sp. Is37]